METGFAVAAFICVVFNLLLPDEVVDEADDAAQQQLRGGAASSSSAADLSERGDAHPPSGKAAERGGVSQVVASGGEAGAALMTITPMTTYAQNNGVIALTRCANRKAGYFCCLFLIIMGVFAKFAAALVAIPAPVLGGMSEFLTHS
ncbi:hypothetical protein MCOR03_011823 [Pyricularia oryzae]|nr:hypothetical protein MCOR03_011823 [Pyricularia oryzae]